MLTFAWCCWLLLGSGIDHAFGRLVIMLRHRVPLTPARLFRNGVIRRCLPSAVLLRDQVGTTAKRLPASPIADPGLQLRTEAGRSIVVLLDRRICKPFLSSMRLVKVVALLGHLAADQNGRGLLQQAQLRLALCCFSSRLLFLKLRPEHFDFHLLRLHAFSCFPSLLLLLQLLSEQVHFGLRGRIIALSCFSSQCFFVQLPSKQLYFGLRLLSAVIGFPARLLFLQLTAEQIHLGLKVRSLAVCCFPSRLLFS
mmetsp:Transcript_10208/g.24501  ORF Transcript_10208/g.24501 Transcript_10208/m.24501 type:complete len:253 (+) Transcript_10208:295-1053(+)